MPKKKAERLANVPVLQQNESWGNRIVILGSGSNLLTETVEFWESQKSGEKSHSALLLQWVQ